METAAPSPTNRNACVQPSHGPWAEPKHSTLGAFSYAAVAQTPQGFSREFCTLWKFLSWLKAFMLLQFSLSPERLSALVLIMWLVHNAGFRQAYGGMFVTWAGLKVAHGTVHRADAVCCPAAGLGGSSLPPLEVRPSHSWGRRFRGSRTWLGITRSVK